MQDRTSSTTSSLACPLGIFRDGLVSFVFRMLGLAVLGRAVLDGRLRSEAVGVGGRELNEFDYEEDATARQRMPVAGSIVSSRKLA